MTPRDFARFQLAIQSGGMDLRPLFGREFVAFGSDRMLLSGYCIRVLFRGPCEHGMSETEQTEKRHSHWWGMLIPRASANAPLPSRLISVALQLPALVVGLCLAIGMLVLTPLVAILVAGIELLFDRDCAARTSSPPPKRRS